MRKTFWLLGITLLIISPRLGWADDKKAESKELFNGKDLSGWKPKDEKRNQWRLMRVVVNDKEPTLFSKSTSETDPYELVCAKPGGTDLLTEQKFGSMLLEIEFMIPKGSNSGIYFMGEYEVQIYDTYGKKELKVGDMASIYTYAAPKVDACKKPGEWQKFIIDFQAPKFEGEKKVENGKFIKVTFNDKVIHENVELTKGVTPGGLTGKEVAMGPLMFQGDHGAVAFRNIKITPKK